MTNIASTPSRRTSQRQLTNNRSAVLPTRREIEVARLNVWADMRTAARGDGGADELRRSLAGFGESLSAAANAHSANSADRYRDEAAAGAADAATGQNADPARQGQSVYQEAFYRVRAESRFNAFAGEIAAEAEAAVNNGDDPSEVQAMVLERFAGFQDEVLDTIPTSTARLDTARRLAELGRTLDTDVTAKLRERVTGESVQALQGNIQADMVSGRALDFEARFAEARALNLPPARAKEVVMQAVVASAVDRDNPNPELLEQLLDSTQADGTTPSLSAAEQILVQDRLTQARALQEQNEREAREDRRDALIAAWYPRALEGEIMDDEIDAAVATGDLLPQEGVQLRGMTEGLRDAAADGHLNEDFLLDVQERIARGSPPSISQVSLWHSQGRFGTGREARRAAISLLGSVGDANRARRGTDGVTTGMTSRQARAQNITLARGYLMGALDPGEGANNYQRSMRARAGMEFNQRVAAGEDPMAVAERFVESFGRHIQRGTPSRRQPRQLPQGDAPTPAGDYVWSP